MTNPHDAFDRGLISHNPDTSPGRPVTAPTWTPLTSPIDESYETGDEPPSTGPVPDNILRDDDDVDDDCDDNLHETTCDHRGLLGAQGVVPGYFSRHKGL